MALIHISDAAAEILGHREFSILGDATEWSLLAVGGDGATPAFTDQYAAIAQRAAELEQASAVLDYQRAIEAYVDSIAQARNYTNGISLAGYVNSTISQWASEAAEFIAWRDDVWLYAYTELDKVQNGLRPQPTVAEFLAELPVAPW